MADTIEAQIATIERETAMPMRGTHEPKRPASGVSDDPRLARCLDIHRAKVAKHRAGRA